MASQGPDVTAGPDAGSLLHDQRQWLDMGVPRLDPIYPKGRVLCVLECVPYVEYVRGRTTDEYLSICLTQPLLSINCMYVLSDVLRGLLCFPPVDEMCVAQSALRRQGRDPRGPCKLNICTRLITLDVGHVGKCFGEKCVDHPLHGTDLIPSVVLLDVTVLI